MVFLVEYIISDFSCMFQNKIIDGGEYEKGLEQAGVRPAHGLLEKRIRLYPPHIGDYNKHVLPGLLPMGIKFLLTKEAGIIMTTPYNAA